MLSHHDVCNEKLLTAYLNTSSKQLCFADLKIKLLLDLKSTFQVFAFYFPYYLRVLV